MGIRRRLRSVGGRPDRGNNHCYQGRREGVDLSAAPKPNVNGATVAFRIVRFLPRPRRAVHRRRSRHSLLVTGLVVGAMVGAVYGASAAGGASATATVTTGATSGTVAFQVGDDATQHAHLAAGTGGNPQAVASAESLLQGMDTVQDVALMGWGAGDPEPTPGQYSWTSLDTRVSVMGATVPAADRMITLCTAPGWMKGGKSQEWNMNAAVTPAHDSDFATLAAQVAERYDGQHRDAQGRLLPEVDQFDVWNSLRGFWDSADNTWDAAGYTTLYNDVYTAIKAVRPDALIGGPYAPLGAASSTRSAVPSSLDGGYGVVDQRTLDALTYWLAHKAGAQFISVDGGPAATATSGFTAGQYFSTVAQWLRGLDPATEPGASTLPLVWAEFYPGLRSAAGRARNQKAVAIDISDMVQAGTAGVNDLLLWEMEGSAAGTSPFTGDSVWTDTAKAGGGASTALATALQALHQDFAPGTTLLSLSTTGPVTALASVSHVLLVNQSAQALTVSVNGRSVVLAPYAVTVTTTT
jgi:hypothetical protein